MNIIKRINENPRYRHLRHLTIGRALSPFRRTTVAVFHIGRSGSTVLTDMLNQHREVAWQYEIYDHVIRDAHRHQKPVTADAEKMLRLFLWKAGPKVCGIEVKFFHLRELHVSLPDYVEMLRKYKFTHYIILERRNYLRTIVSVLSAYKSSVWHHNKEAKLQQVEIPTDNVTVEYFTAPLVRHLEIYEEEFKQVEALLKDVPLLKLTYEEDIANDPYEGYQRACKFIGLKPKNAAVRLKKVNPFPLRQMITNYDEVARALQGTRFEWMLNE